MNSTTWTPRWPLDFESSINRYARWGADFVTVVDQGALYRVCSTGSPYRIRQLDNGSIEVAGEDDLEPAVEESRFRFAETLEREAVVALGERIPAIGQQLARIPGYRPPMNAAVLESLVASICTQQVNLQWAATTRARLVERFGVRHGFAGVDVWAFPAAKILAAADPGEIRAMQFTTRKSEYIVDVARAVADGELEGLENDADEAVIRRIVSIRGLGRWTVEWFLARTLARPHAIAAGDLGVRKAISRFVADVDETLSEPDIRHIAEDWGDGGNWATHLLLEQLSEA